MIFHCRFGNKEVGTVAPLASHLGLLVKMNTILVSSGAEGFTGNFCLVSKVNLEASSFSINIDARA